MALAGIVDTLDSVSESVREYYEPTEDGRFALAVDGMQPDSAVTAVKDALNKRLRDQTEKLKLLSGGLSRDEVLEAIRDAAKGMHSGDGDGGRGTDAEREIAALKAAKEQAEAEAAMAIAQRQESTIGFAVTSAVAAAGVLPQSAEIVGRAIGDVFEVAGDGTVRSKVDCEFGADLTPAEVAEKMRTDVRFAPFWPASKSGGSSSGGDGAGGDGNNPFLKANWNLSAQAALVREDMSKAQRMASAAGVTIGATKPVR